MLCVYYIDIVLTSAKNNAIFKTEMEVLNMVNTNLNIRTDKEVKNQAEKIFNALE